MINKKICIYAICKNESKFVKRWLDSMAEADYIVVLDTGSTDNTVKLLKNDPRVTKVEKRTIKPWRFDSARNESMKLVPEDADILVCTDLDEVFEPGWAKILKENWQDDDDRCYYQYAWSHNQLGEPQDIFTYDKIHTKDYHWVFPVHEVLYPNDDTKTQKIFDAGDSIFLHHLQDPTKPRSSYFDLLKISVEENPEESHCRMLLAREYFLNGDNENALKEYEACLNYKDILDPNKQLVLLETLNRIGDLYFLKKDYDTALHFYTEHLKIDPTHREPYLLMGEMYNEMHLYGLAKSVLLYALNECTRHYDWTERKETWTAAVEDALSVACYNLHQYNDALDYVKIAAQHNPDNVRIIKNMNHILLSVYEGVFTEEAVY